MFKLCIALAAVVAIASGKPSWPLSYAAPVYSPSYVAPAVATYSAYSTYPIAPAVAPVAPAVAPVAPAVAPVAPAVAPVAPAVVAPVSHAVAPVAPVVAAAPVASPVAAVATAPISTYAYAYPAYTSYSTPYLVKK